MNAQTVEFTTEEQVTTKGTGKSMSKAMNKYERESLESLKKTLDIGGRQISLMAILTMADLRLRRVKNELNEMRGFSILALRSVPHTGLKTCPRCKLEHDYGMLPEWRRILAESSGEDMSAECQRITSQMNMCPMRKS